MDTPRAPSIERLPPEVLVKVLRWAAPSFPRTPNETQGGYDVRRSFEPTGFCLVNRRWKRVVEEAHALWTVVQLPLSAATRAIERSGQLPLIVKVHYDDSELGTMLPTLEALRHILRDHWHRVEAMYVPLYSVLRDEGRLVDDVTENLRELQLTDNWDGELFPDPSGWLPRLEHISPEAVIGCVGTIRHPSFGPGTGCYNMRTSANLTDVTATNYGDSNGFSIESLFRNPGIRTIDVSWAGTAHDLFRHDLIVDQVLAMERLEVLRLQNVRKGFVEAICGKLWAPILREVVVECISVLVVDYGVRHQPSKLFLSLGGHDNVVERLGWIATPSECRDIEVKAKDGRIEVRNTAATVRIQEDGGRVNRTVLWEIAHAFGLESVERWGRMTVHLDGEVLKRGHVEAAIECGLGEGRIQPLEYCGSEVVVLERV